MRADVSGDCRTKAAGQRRNVAPKAMLELPAADAKKKRKSAQYLARGIRLLWHATRSAAADDGSHGALAPASTGGTPLVQDRIAPDDQSLAVRVGDDQPDDPSASTSVHLLAARDGHKIFVPTVSQLARIVRGSVTYLRSVALMRMLRRAWGTGSMAAASVTTWIRTSRARPSGAIVRCVICKHRSQWGRAADETERL